MKGFKYTFWLLFAVCLVTVIGCSNASRPEPPQAASSPAPIDLNDREDHRAMAPAPASASPVYVAYKTVLAPSDAIQEHPYSFVYFPKAPTTTRLKDHYKAICEMYVETFADKPTTAKYLDHKTEKLLPVFWFSKKTSEEQPCDALIKDYDYQRAKFVIKSLKRSYDTPNLVAYFGNYIVRMNLAGVEKQEDLDLAFSVWKEHIATYPQKEKDLTIVSVVYSARKVLGAFGTILTFSKG